MRTVENMFDALWCPMDYFQRILHFTILLMSGKTLVVITLTNLLLYNTFASYMGGHKVCDAKEQRKLAEVLAHFSQK